MHAKKASPTGSSTPRHEPDLSHLATRKVDTVSSLAAEMMLRQADEDAALSAQKQASSPPPEAVTPAPELPMQTISPFPPASAPYPPASSSSPSHPSLPPPAWSTVRSTASRSEHRSDRRERGARVAILVLAGLLLATLSAAAAFVLTR